MWITIIFVSLILILFCYLDTRKPKNYPPGPRWLPILGCALTIEKLRKHSRYLHLAAVELSKQYGPVIGLKVGKDLIVVCNDYSSIKAIFTAEEFSGRPKGIFYKIRTWGIRRGVLLTDKFFWQEQRRFVLRHLKEFGYGKDYMAKISENEAEQLQLVIKKKVDDSNGAVILEMRKLFGIHVINTLWMMLASIRYAEDDSELQFLQGILTKMFENIDMIGTKFSHFPFLRYLAPKASGYTMFLQTHQQLWKFLNNELQKHKKSYKNYDLRDFMDSYLEELDNSTKKESFTEIQLLAICLDLFIAGSETTNKTLEFMFLYLLLYPEVQKKAQEEIDAIIGRERFPHLSDRNKMPYMECLVLESIRMFIGRSFSVPHRAIKDAILNGYFIPKDTMMLVNFNPLLMDKDYWGDPEVFRPERFLKDGKVQPPDNFFPFGLGKHRCIGETLARANVFLFSTILLQSFNFSVVSIEKKPTTEIIDGATPAPKPYKALITHR